MTTKKDNFSTVTALLRTAEWQVEAARTLYIASDKAQSTAASAREDALRAKAEAEQLTRDLLGRVPLNAEVLCMASLNQSQVNQDLEHKEQQCCLADEALKAACRDLLAARTQAKGYQRLLERRLSVFRLETIRDSYHDADDAGAIRVIATALSEYGNVVEEKNRGN